MKKQRSYLKSWLVLTALTTFFCLGTSASAQYQPVRNNQPVQDNDTTRQELARVDQFLDDHPDIAEQVRKDQEPGIHGNFALTVSVNVYWFLEFEVVV